MRKSILIALFLPILCAAEPCPADAVLKGLVIDQSGAVVEGAAISLLSSTTQSSALSGNNGEFALNCVSLPYRIRVAARGFALREITARKRSPITIQLALADLKQSVTVDEASETGSRVSEPGFGTLTLDSKAVAALADDPDDLQRQLQTLAASSGGAPGQATISVDGFQTGGLIPPKSAIASIRINPDLYSAEYASPPYQGGRIEILTKPGGAPEGSVFLTEGPGALSANTPFSQSGTPANLRRYGFELGGPIRRNKSDYFVALEKRDIDEYSVVNASGLNGPIHQSVPMPKVLWLGSLRSTWQLSARNTLVAALSTLVVNRRADGTGGLVLAEAGFNSGLTENTFRLTDTMVLSPNLLFQSRASSTWRQATRNPLSTASSVNVAGSFIGGGAQDGHQDNRGNDIEFDNNLSWIHGAHSFKFGADVLTYRVDNRDWSLFNGSFLFAGPSSLAQYRAASLSTPGAAATTYQVISGNPEIAFAQVQAAVYLQDQWKLRPGLSASIGLRYAAQTSPSSAANLTPRLGLAWAPGRKNLWVLRVRTGLFRSPITASTTEMASRLDGINRIDTLAYGASFANPGSAQTLIQSRRQLASGLMQSPSLQSQFAIERQLPKHWQAQASVSLVQGWHSVRLRNINAPLTDAQLQRPYAPNLNLFQFEPSGSVRGPVVFASLSQHSYKLFNIFFGYLYSNLRSNADTPTYSPQSSYGSGGDMARVSWAPTHQTFAVGQISLPKKITLSEEFSVSAGTPYNVVTGADNNGDGVFNDRPGLAGQLAPGIVQTPFGLLDPLATNGTLPRNIGRMPTVYHLDGNLSRIFQLKLRGLTLDRRQTLSVNLRVANLLNHTNVTSVGNIAGSPTFGQAISAESARRVEFGLRLKF